MNRLPRILFVAIPTLLLSCGREETPPPFPNQPDGIPQDPGDNTPAIPANQPEIFRIGAGEPGKDGWCLAESTRGNFSVMLPGKFFDSMLEMGTLTGGTARMHTVATTTADGLEFNVLQTEVVTGERPPGSAQDLMKERFAKLGATVNQEKVVLAGHPAVRLDVSAKGVTAVMILLTVSNSDYMLAVQSRGRSPKRKMLLETSERFFQSFRIRG